MAATRGNIVWLALMRVVLIVSGIVVQLLLTRWLGDGGYGIFATLQSVAMLMTFIGHMNLQVLLAREVAREPDEAATWLGNGLTAIALTAIPAMSLVVGYTWLVDGRPDVVALAFPAALTTVAMSIGVVIQGTLQGLRQMRSFPVANLVGRMALLGGLIAVLMAGYGIAAIFLTQTAALLITAGILGIFAIRAMGVPRLPSFAAVLRTLRDAIPFAASRLFSTIYLASDVLVIAAFHTDAAVGHYKIAALLLTNLSVVSGIFVDALFPRLSKAHGDPEQAGVEISFALRMLLLLGVPMAVGAMCVAYDLVDLVLEDSFLVAVPAMLVLLPILPVRFSNHLAGSALSAFDRQPVRARSTLWAALLNVGLNLAIVPFFGGLGAACTTLATEGLLSAYLWWRVSPDVRGVRILRPLVGIGIAVGAMACAVLAVGLIPLPLLVRLLLQIAVGALVYGGITYALRVWRIHDLRRIRGI